MDSERFDGDRRDAAEARDVVARIERGEVKLQRVYLYDEEHCPGHAASTDDPKICHRCGVHVDSLR